jgi:hypothetical protein
MSDQEKQIQADNNEDTTHEKPKESGKQQRNPGLSVLLIFSFVYNGILLLILIAGLFYPGLVHDTLQQYYKQVYLSGTLAFLINLSAVLVMGMSFYGLILLWQNRKKGFWFFALAQAIVLITLFLVLRSYDWINAGVMIVILIILGISSRSMD